MSETIQLDAPKDDSQIVSIYFPRGEAEIITKANEKLVPKGFTRNFILLEAVRLGLPAVLKKYRRKSAPTSFTNQVLRVVLSFRADEEITTQIVADKLEQEDPKLKTSHPSGFDNISKVLERLGDRQILTSDAMAGRKKVWHLSVGSKEVERLLKEINAPA